MTRPATDADGIDLIYPGPDGTTPYFQGEPITDAADYERVRTTIRARRAELRADRLYGTPCIACGAPIRAGVGHDPGCPALSSTNSPAHQEEPRMDTQTKTTALLVDDEDYMAIQSALEEADNVELYEKLAVQFDRQTKAWLVDQQQRTLGTA